jgi:hypothetical protein
MLAVVISTVLTFVACGPSAREQFDVAIAEGRLSDALKILPEVDSGAYSCSTTLIDEYLAIGDIDKAIYVFDKVLNRCSVYQMKYENLYSTSQYTKQNSQKIYKKLIAADRLDDAWAYHPLSYESDTYPGNAPQYFAYMVDVITHLCVNNRKTEAQRFLTTHIHWFTKNVDNHEYGEDYRQYSKSIMHSQLLDVLNSF